MFVQPVLFNGPLARIIHTWVPLLDARQAAQSVSSEQTTGVYHEPRPRGRTAEDRSSPAGWWEGILFARHLSHRPRRSTMAARRSQATKNNGSSQRCGITCPNDSETGRATRIVYSSFFPLINTDLRIARVVFHIFRMPSRYRRRFRGESPPVLGTLWADQGQHWFWPVGLSRLQCPPGGRNATGRRQA